MRLNPDQFSSNIPKRAKVKNSGLGIVRITHYHGNGYFNTVDNRDTQRLMHRDNLTFLRDRKAK